MRHILITLILATLMVGVAQADPTDLVDVTLLNYQPTPAQPGDLLDVRIQVSNEGNAVAEDIEITLQPSETFDPQGSTTLTLPSLGAGNTYTALFKVKVRATASAGDHILFAEAVQSGKDMQRHELEISVLPDDAALFITDVQTTPTQLFPGKEATVTLFLENIQDTTLRDVTIELDLSDSPFIPIQGTTRQKISTLLPQRTAQIVYTLQARPSATADVYRVPVDVTFLDELGSEQTSEDIIGLAVDTLPDTQAYVDDVRRVADGVEVSIRIVNKGLSEIKFVEATIDSGEGYTVSAQDKNVYLGNIDSDDWETVRITIQTDAEAVTIPVAYTFQDAFNNELTRSQAFELDIPAQEGNSGATAWTVIIILAIAVVGFVWWRRRKK